MQTFEDVKLSWHGTGYTIPANRVMGAIARIEAQVTLSELIEMSQKGRIRFSSIAAAYASVLRYAGADLTDEACYIGLFKENSAAVANAALAGLLQMLLPPETFAGKDAPQGNVEAPAASSS